MVPRSPYRYARCGLLHAVTVPGSAPRTVVASSTRRARPQRAAGPPTVPARPLRASSPPGWARCAGLRIVDFESATSAILAMTGRPSTATAVGNSSFGAATVAQSISTLAVGRQASEVLSPSELWFIQTMARRDLALAREKKTRVLPFPSCYTLITPGGRLLCYAFEPPDPTRAQCRAGRRSRGSGAAARRSPRVGPKKHRSEG